MANTVLLVQKSDFQKTVWERILNSQELIPITESSETELLKLLKKENSLAEILPKLIILEMSIEQLNPYDVCRCVQGKYPDLKVILTAEERIKISETEQRWARNQGAYELLPGFDKNQMDSSVIKGMAVVMSALNKTEWEQDALVQIIEDLSEEFYTNEEPKTFIQSPETVIQKPSVEEDNSETTEHDLKPIPDQEHLSFRLKPKVKRFRGLPY